MYRAPCAPCPAQNPCPAIPACPASAPCTVITKTNSNTVMDQANGGQSGVIRRGFGSVKGKGKSPNNTDDATAGSGHADMLLVLVPRPVCPYVTCTAGACNANANTTVAPLTSTTSSSGGGYRKALSSGQIGGIVLGALGLCYAVCNCKYARFFLPRRKEPRRRRPDHRLRHHGDGIEHHHRHRTAIAGTGIHASSSAPISPATATAGSSPAASPAFDIEQAMRSVEMMYVDDEGDYCTIM